MPRPTWGNHETHHETHPAGSSDDLALPRHILRNLVCGGACCAPPHTETDTPRMVSRLSFNKSVPGECMVSFGHRNACAATALGQTEPGPAAASYSQRQMPGSGPTRAELLAAQQLLERQIEILTCPAGGPDLHNRPPDNRQIIAELEAELAEVNSSLKSGPAA